jgi:Vacuole effluxer Atg22 like
LLDFISVIAHQDIQQFFGVMGLFSRSASVVGPNVIQAIIDKNGSNWKAFLALFAISVLGSVVLWLGVNVPKGRHAAAQWATEKRGTSTGVMILDEMDSESSESKIEGKSDGREKI